jgi:hypothetical protein
VSLHGGQQAGTLRMLGVHGVAGVACFLLECLSKCRKIQSMASGCSAGTVADHSGTVTTVV